MCMDYISTTELRTKSSQLIEALGKGITVSLIHRSKVVGEIKPKRESAKPFDPMAFKKLADELNLPKLSYKEREKRYRKHMMEKYGKSISRRKHSH